MNTATKRNLRLRREVGRLLASGLAETLSEALIKVIDSPLPKGFYIAPDTAIQTDQRRRKVGTTNYLSKVKQQSTRQKWTDFFAAVDELHTKYPTITHEKAVLDALSSATAPHGFYIDFHEAIKILRQ